MNMWTEFQIDNGVVECLSIMKVTEKSLLATFLELNDKIRLTITMTLTMCMHHGPGGR